MARYTCRFEGEPTYHLRIHNSFDRGASWQTFLDATYKKI
jgi:hypothetical protein